MINLSWKCVHGIFRFLCCGMAFWKQKKKHSCFQGYVGVPKPMLKRFRLEKSGLPDNWFTPELWPVRTWQWISHMKNLNILKNNNLKTMLSKVPKTMLKRFGLEKSGLPDNLFTQELWPVSTWQWLFHMKNLNSEWPQCFPRTDWKPGWFTTKPFKTDNESITLMMTRDDSCSQRRQTKTIWKLYQTPIIRAFHHQHSATPWWSEWKACDERGGTQRSAWDLQCSPSLRMIMMQYIYIYIYFQ